MGGTSQVARYGGVFVLGGGLIVFGFLVASLFVPLLLMMAFGRGVALKACVGLLVISLACAIVFLTLASHMSPQGDASFATMFLSTLTSTGVMAGWVVVLCVLRIRESGGVVVRDGHPQGKHLAPSSGHRIRTSASKDGADVSEAD